MRVTPSARRDLLDVVVRLKQRDRDSAVRFVAAVEDRLADPAGGLLDVPELGSPAHAATAAEGHRLYLRERSDGWWLIAVWPDPGTLR